jgi:hypothetical protein
MDVRTVVKVLGSMFIALPTDRELASFIAIAPRLAAQGTKGRASRPPVPSIVAAIQARHHQ